MNERQAVNVEDGDESDYGRKLARSEYRSDRCLRCQVRGKSRQSEFNSSAFSQQHLFTMSIASTLS